MYIGNETIAAADVRANVHSTEVQFGDKFLADTVNNTAATQLGQKMILNAAGTSVNNTGTDVAGATGVFRMLQIIGAAADRKAIVELVN